MPSRTKNKISVLVVDDEPLARDSIRALLADEVSISWMEECGSGEEAVDLVRRFRPDLVFLDVQMPGCNGFDVIKNLGFGALPSVIFITAFDEHAVKAFEAGALDYLVKPFSNDRFWRAFYRAKTQIIQGTQDRLASVHKFEMLASNSIGKNDSMDRVSLDQLRALAEFRFQLRRFLSFSEAASEQLGVSVQQYQLMQVIAAKPPGKRASISYLSQRLVLRQSSTVELVDRAERSGLVHREPDKNDMRLSLVRLTPRGDALLQLLVKEQLVEVTPHCVDLLGPLQDLLQRDPLWQLHANQESTETVIVE